MLEQTMVTCTPLMLAAINNHDSVVHVLLSDSQCLMDAKDQDGYTALHYSCSYGYVNIVRTLFEHKADVNTRTYSGNTPLKLAAICNHDNVVHALLSNSQCLVDAKGYYGFTALHYSCKSGRVGLVRTLVNHNADVNARTDNGDTPLTLAAKHRLGIVVHALLSDSQCLVDAKGQDGFNALHYSCRYDHVDIVKILVNHMADVNARTDSGDTPLTLAIKHKHGIVVNALLSNSKCLVDAKVQDGFTALHFSCKSGSVGLVRTLVNHKADVNARTDNNCDTPLTLAIKHKHGIVVNALLSNSKCLVDAKVQDGFTALHFSCKSGSVGLVRTLVNHKADVNARTDNNCDTPLTLAIKHKHGIVVNVLLSNSKCLVDAKVQDGFTALHFSCKSGSVGLVRTLVNHKADVNARTDSGDTPLTLAVRHGHDNVVHALSSDLQCLVNAKGQDGFTVLHLSCKCGNVGLVRTLVKHKADVNVRTESGDTPLTLAAINKHDNVVHALSVYNCEVYAKDKDAYTALLHLSCERGYVSVVRILLNEHEADINLNARTDRDHTPLTLAAINKHDNVVHALSEYNCEVYAKDKDAYTALLHLSCERGYVSIVRILLNEQKADINARTDSGDTPLLLAIEQGHDNVVHVLLSDSQCQMNAKGQDGYTALHFSCKNGHVDMVTTLVSHKANVNARTDNGDTPLTLAAINKHDNVVHALSDYNCEVYAKDKGAYTALLHLSCKRGYVGIVRILLNEHKANVNTRTGSGDTPLTLAARYKQDNVVHALSDYNCEVYAKDRDAYAVLLHLSCKRGYVGIVRTLLNEHKAKVNARIDSGDTPLTLAAKHDHDNVVHALLSYSQCLVDAKGQDGYTALHYACRDGHVDIVKTLVKHKVNVNARTDSGFTPLTLAAINKHDNVVHALSDYNCEVYAKDKDAYTVLLHSSCERGYVDIVRTLVNDHKVDVNARTCNDITPLLLAIVNGHDTVVNALLSDYRCQVDARINFGFTALHYTCMKGLIDIVKILIKHKADVDAKTNSGYTPLHVAALYGQFQVIVVLMHEFNCNIYAKGHAFE